MKLLPIFLPKRQRGAALLTVLVVMLMLTLLLSATHETIQERITLATTAQELLEEKAAATTKASQLIYLLTTQRQTLAGISQGQNPKGLLRLNGEWLNTIAEDELRLDSFPYKEEINGVSVTFSLQGERGLIPVNIKDSLWLRMLLMSYGIDERETQSYLDKLTDYADGDNSLSPSGAETNQYLDENLPPPRNFLLQTCSELKLIMDWRELVDEYPQIINQCSLVRSGNLNLNTVPEPLLRQVWPEAADTVLNARANGNWITTSRRAINILPKLALIDDEYYTPTTESSVIINVETENTVTRFYVKLGTNKIIPFSVYIR